jgi:hypothetical protein
LVQVAAEIPEDATLEPDANDFSPYRTALDTIWRIGSQWSLAAEDHPMLPVVWDLFGRPELTWQLQCAGLLALANFPYKTSDYIPEWVALVVAFLPVVESPENPPLIRIAALMMIEQSLPPELWPAPIVNSLLDCLSNILASDDHPQVKVLAVRCLDRCSIWSCDTFPVLMSIINAALPQAIPAMIPYIARAIGHISFAVSVKRTKNCGVVFATGLSMLCELLAQTEGEIVTRIEIFWAVSYAISGRRELSEDVHQLAISSIRELWDLREVPVNEEAHRHWQDAIC